MAFASPGFPNFPGESKSRHNKCEVHQKQSFGEGRQLRRPYSLGAGWLVAFASFASAIRAGIPSSICLSLMWDDYRS
jgi:hypothetical protein